MTLKNCCQSNKKTKKCVREDGKEFTFPRRFSKEKCLKQPIRGYSMKSSCAPFINCSRKLKKKSGKSNKSNKKIKINQSNKRKMKGGAKAKNILGKPLQICSIKPLTGYNRQGSCEYVFGDSGKHLVCAKMNKKFLDYTKSQGNDLSSVVKVGQNWCLCESRWLQAYEVGKAPLVVMEATSELTDSEIQKKIKLSSLKKKSKRKKSKKIKIKKFD